MFMVSSMSPVSCSGGMACAIYCSPVLISIQADKQTLQEELERQLSEKDKEIAILTSENEVGQMASYSWVTRCD